MYMYMKILYFISKSNTFVFGLHTEVGDSYQWMGLAVSLNFTKIGCLIPEIELVLGSLRQYLIFYEK